MNCPKCSLKNPEEARFCRGCGTRLNGIHDVPTLADESLLPQLNKEPATSFVGQTLDGKYRLESILGRGGMGTVYVATRLHIGDNVAVKILHPEFAKDLSIAERFRREAQAAARLKHPNAVSIYDFGLTSNGLSYLVMELIEGHSLRQLIKKQGAIDPSTAVEIIRQTCAALEEAHHRKIVHRDLKPDNIVLQTTPSGPRVKVLDFGIAKLHDLSTNTLTQTGTTMGTPQYMSPEQCLGQEVDSRSDIYSLGIVLYEMLCGVTPFNATTPMGQAVQQVNDTPPSLCTRSPHISAALEAVVLQMLRKQPEARLQTAASVARELQAAVNPGAIPAFAADTKTDLKTPMTSAVEVPASGGTPIVSQPVFASASASQAQVSLAQAPPVQKGSHKGLIVFGVVLLLVLTSAAVAGTYFYIEWQRANRRGALTDPTRPRPRPSAQPSVDTPEPHQSPTPDSVDEQLDVLNERRLDATPGQLPDIDEALQEMEQKYPADYRFTYVRAKIALVGSHEHHDAFAKLFLAGQKAIDNGKAAAMLSDLTKDSDREFFALAHGHSEWNTLLAALRSNNKGALQVHA